MREIGFTWSAEMLMTINYIWRGLYVGGLSAQPEASVGWGGLNAGIWWNIGMTDWSGKTPHPTFNNPFFPEVDAYVSFSRWGVTLTWMQMYYFDRYADGSLSKPFDYKNYPPGGGGITSEFRVKYQVSSKLPLSILWCTRFAGRDGYLIPSPDGEMVGSQPKQVLKRAYSSYLEIGYDAKLDYNMLIQARVGMTPWKSLYTEYEGDFAVVNLNLKIWKSWELDKHLDLSILGEVMVNPHGIHEVSENDKPALMAREGIILNAGVRLAVK